MNIITPCATLLCSSQVLVDDNSMARGFMLPHVITVKAVQPTPEMLTADPPPPPDKTEDEKVEEEEAAKLAAEAPVADGGEAVDPSMADPEAVKKVKPAPPAPDITLPDIAPPTTPAGTCTPRSILNLEFLRSYSPEQIAMIKESEKVAAAALEEYEADKAAKLAAEEEAK